MDTRAKIVGVEEAAAWARLARADGARVTLVLGHFDPLLAEHARGLSALAEAGGWLVVAVSDPPGPILPIRARAELVAALRVVDCVVEGEGAGIPSDAVHDERAADLQRAEEFQVRVRALAGSLP